MRSTTPGVEPLLARFAEVLDEEVQTLELRRSQLARLSENITRRDDTALEATLGQIAQAMAAQAELDGKLADLRTALANALLCAPEEISLTALLEKVPLSHRAALAERRRQVLEQIQRLKQQHLATSILLLESARINRLMLEAMFPASAGVTTYDPVGPSRWLPDTGVVDAER